MQRDPSPPGPARPEAPARPAPRLLAIKVMMGIGIIWLGVVLLSAAQTPRGAITEASVGDLAARTPGFELAFPPRPVPGALRDQLPAARPVVAVFVPRPCDAGCRGVISSLSSAAVRPPTIWVIARGLDPVRLGLPPRDLVFLDENRAFEAYRGSGDRPLVVAYGRDGEIGRSRRTDWSSPPAAALLGALDRE